MKTLWASKILKFLHQLIEQHGDVKVGKERVSGVITVVIKYDTRSDEITMSESS